MIVDVYHNILWSKYKGGVFSALHRLASEPLDYRFFQIASSSGQRKGLSSVDLRFHQYPYELLYDTAYENIPKIRLSLVLFWRVISSRADLVVIPGYHEIEYWCMLLACVLTGKRRAVFVDSTRLDRPVSRVRDALKKVFFGFCTGFFCYGTRSSEYLSGLGVPAEKIYVRCQAAALPLSYREDEVRAIRRSSVQSKAPYTYLYVGRLSPEKGLDILLAAFARLVATVSDVRLVMVGSGPDSDALKRLSKQLGLDSRVNFAGPAELEQLAGYYLAADCLVLPSRSEPWGLVANEAFSYGCPLVVSSHCGCAPDLVIEGRTGFVFCTDDADALVVAMQRARNELGRRAEVAEACMNHIAAFTPAMAASQIDAGCRKMLGIDEARTVV